MLLIGLTAQAPIPTAPQSDLLLDRIMQGLAAVPERRTSYIEERQLGAVKGVLRSSGTTLYHRPGHLEQHVIEPKPEDIVFDSHFLIIQRPGEPIHTLDINSQPALRILGEGIRAPLSGDVGELRRVFITHTEGDIAHWKLLLMPRDPSVTRFIKSIQLTGQHDVISEIYSVQANGDTDRKIITIIK